MSFDSQHTASYYAATARNAAPYPSLDSELTADVCVVGGGLTGVNTALELAERGFRWCCWKAAASAGAPADATAAS